MADKQRTRLERDALQDLANCTSQVLKQKTLIQKQQDAIRTTEAYAKESNRLLLEGVKYSDKMHETIQEMVPALDASHVVLLKSSVALNSDPNPIPLIEAVMKKAKELGYE